MIRSHGLSILAIACCCSAAIASAFHATRLSASPAPQEPQTPHPVFVAQHELLGVEIHASAAGAAPSALGAITDLVLDAYTGQVRSAVLTLPPAAASDTSAPAAPRSVMTPWARLARDPATGTVTTALTAAELAALPAFTAGTHGLRALAAAATAKADADAEDATTKKGDATPAPAKARPATLLASDCSGLGVFGREHRFGTCSELVFEQRTGVAAFAIVTRGTEAGAQHTSAVPWTALALQKAATAIPAHLRIDRSTEELATAPELERGTDSLAQQPTRQEIYTFHHVATPPYDVRIDLKRAAAPTAGRDRR